MNKRPPLIHDEDLLVKIIGASFLVMWLKGGLAFILLMFIYFFINERIERKKWHKAMKYIKDHDFPYR